MFCNTRRGYAIRMVKGDTIRYDISILSGLDHIPYELFPEDVIHFRMKKYVYDKEPLIEKFIPVSDPILEILPEDTSDLMFGEYHYNIELILQSGDVYTFIPDSPFIIIQKV